ncbi:hypothetical protein SteCoe_28904 [Stentor coeruleus]|uniref:Peptidase M14 domain-containing protein n=1 Tax=Stentor coeruleus TaxID=5963 RepID=A0A1R2B788_9CILI|nr:hypothetical protein SteCoe_28904 [Stentor coeruleus]
MKIWQLLSLLFLTQGHISLGSLNGYLNSSEIISTLNNLTIQYPSLLSQSSLEIFDRLILQNSSYHPEYTKPLILVLGGFYGGYPLGTFQVLEIAEHLASGSLSGDPISSFIVNSFEIHFIPVLNKKAYQYMEENYSQGNFPVIKTGMENYQGNCPSPDNGINPYHNFPYSFEILEDKCSNDYAGESPGESEITNKFLHVYYQSERIPSFSFNYQGTGNLYKIPFTSSDASISSAFGVFVEYTKTVIPDDYKIVQAFQITNESEYGTYLDYSISNSTGIFEVALGKEANLTSDLIIQEADKNYNTFASVMEMAYIKSNFYFDSAIEARIVGNNDSEPYSNVEFTFTVTNENYLPFDHHLKFNPGFQDSNSFKFKNIICAFVSVYMPQGNVYIMNSTKITLTDTTIFEFTNVAPGYSNFTYTIIYEKLRRNSGRDYYFQANLSSSEFYLEAKVLNEKGEIEMVNEDDNNDHNDGNDDEDEKKGVIVGFVLLIVLLILVSIAGVVFYCSRRRHDFEQKLDQDPRIPQAGEARI